MRKYCLISILLLLVTGYVHAQKIEFKKVSPKEFHSLIEEKNNHLLIDVSCEIECQAGKIPGAICAETSETLFSILDTTPSSRSVLVYCKFGKRSQKACWLIKEKYPHKVYTLKGGVKLWIENGFTVDSAVENKSQDTSY